MSNTNSKHPPLPIPREKWRRRWMVLNSWNCLHRISEIEWEDEDEISGDGISVCGQRGRYQIPGLFSRMGLRRCKHCCRVLEIPDGEGSPANDESLPYAEI